MFIKMISFLYETRKRGCNLVSVHWVIKLTGYCSVTKVMCYVMEILTMNKRHSGTAIFSVKVGPRKINQSTLNNFQRDTVLRPKRRLERQIYHYQKKLFALSDN